MHNYHWERFLGRRLSESVIGVIGIGRIGSRVIEQLSGFKCKRVLANDTDPLAKSRVPKYVTMVDKEKIYREADVITIHVPLTGRTRGMIDRKQFEMFKNTSILINTARGAIVDEDALYTEISSNRLRAAFDVFWQEPYDGKLMKFHPDSFFMSPHVASTCSGFLKGCRNGLDLLIKELKHG